MSVRFFIAASMWKVPFGKFKLCFVSFNNQTEKILPFCNVRKYRPNQMSFSEGSIYWSLEIT